MFLHVCTLTVLLALGVYVWLSLPGGYMWSKRRVHDHKKVVKMLAGVLGVAATPGTVLAMLHTLVEEIELHPNPENKHPFFKIPAVAQLHHMDGGFSSDPATRFRQTITHFAEQALPKQRGPYLFSYRDVTTFSDVAFWRRWERTEPYDDFEQRRLVRYLRSEPRVSILPDMS